MGIRTEAVYASILVRDYVAPGECARVDCNDKLFSYGHARGNVGPRELPFRGRVVAVYDNPECFLIEDITVGGVTQFAQPGAIPAECFSETAVGTEMDMDVLTKESTLTITVRNRSDKTELFYCIVSGLYGETEPK